MVFLYASLLRTNPVDYNIGKTANLPSPTYDRLALFLRQHNMCLRVFMFSSSFLSFFLFFFLCFLTPYSNLPDGQETPVNKID